MAKKRRYPYPWVAVVAMGASGLAATGCGPSARVVATATLTNSADIVDDEPPLVLDSPLGGAGERVATLASELRFLRTVSLGVLPAGTTTDAFYLQIFSRPSVAATDSPSDSSDQVVRRGDFSLIDPQIDQMLTLSLEVPTASSPTTTAAPPLDPTRRQVTAWLARVQNDDRTIRWSVAPGSPGCVPDAGGCFDMRGAATMILTAIDGAVSAAVNPRAAGGTDPDPQIRMGAGRVSLVSFIPNLETPASRGVGFVFAIDLEARLFGDAAVGSPYHNATVYLPVALLFARTNNGGLGLTIDPLDLRRPGLFGPPAIELRNALPGPPVEANLVADVIASRMAAILRAGIVLPPGPPLAGGVPSGRLLDQLILAALGGVPPSSGFNVVLVPETSLAIHGQLVSPLLLPAADHPGVQLVFLE